MAKIICAWCKRPYKPGPSETHGICPACARKYQAGNQALAFVKAFIPKEDGKR